MATHVPRGGYRFSEHEDDALVARSLGSGIALIIRCQNSGSMALAHIPFPDSKVDPGQGENQPGLFADTGVRELVRQFKARGVSLLRESTKVALVGGAGIKNVNKEFDTGSRNIEAVQKHILDLGLSITAEDLGRNLNRTVSVDPGQNSITITAPGQRPWFL
ncbi:MAG: chemotaxis protein CheD [Desulfohalobiaceae bacterium]|nr:chemotaxis protein CheD [Desulfohalobiaceae bacterium]